jgi:hypothetical protein
MSLRRRATGEYFSVYLASPIYLHIEQQARLEGIGVATWIRNAVLVACPPEIRISAGQFARGRKPRPTPGPAEQTAAPECPADPAPAKRQSAAAAKTAAQASFDALVERSRADVLALTAKGYRDNAIAAITRLPYRVVQHITATEAAAQKRRRKG